MKCFFCFSIHKSGHHPIMNWISSHLSPVRWERGHPSFPEVAYIPGARVQERFSNRTGRRLKHAYKQLFSSAIVNMEDQLPRNFAHAEHPRTLNLVDVETCGVLILRDPFNNLASIFEHLKTLKKKGKDIRGSFLPKSCLSVWKQHAREYLGDTQFLPNRINVNFNFWLKNPEYRDSITSELGGEPDDRVLHYLTLPGYGSSFDGTDYKGKPQEMDLLNRWKSCGEIYHLLRDEETIDLATRIFGEDFVLPITKEMKG